MCGSHPDHPTVHIHVTRTLATIDTGERKDAWCFCCRRRTSFALVVRYPDSVYYDPTAFHVCRECSKPDTDAFGASCFDRPPISFAPAGTPVPPLSDLALDGA